MVGLLGVCGLFGLNGHGEKVTIPDADGTVASASSIPNAKALRCPSVYASVGLPVGMF